MNAAPKAIERLDKVSKPHRRTGRFHVELVPVAPKHNNICIADAHQLEVQKMKSFLVKTFLTVSGLLIGCELALATTIFTLGNNPSGDVNILLNSGATGTTVQGAPNGFPTLTVNFTSSQVLLEPSSGQARISANP